MSFYVRERARRGAVRRILEIRASTHSKAGVLLHLVHPVFLLDEEELPWLSAFLGTARTPVACLTNLYVPPRRRRNGIGAALTREALRIAAQEGSAHAILNPERGREERLIPFYERLGFRVLGMTPHAQETMMGCHLP